jgi:hypothetical protein
MNLVFSEYIKKNPPTNFWVAVDARDNRLV